MSSDLDTLPGKTSTRKVTVLFVFARQHLFSDIAPLTAAVSAGLSGLGHWMVMPPKSMASNTWVAVL